tara:strand:- start:181 stop:525 length:345 start_codon:yes stop_codon:yes gene_type:complete
MKLVAVIFVAASILVLVRRNLLQVDLSFPLFAGLVLLGFASMSEGFMAWVAELLGFVDPPFAIIMLTFTFLLAMITVLTIALTRMRHRQIMMVRHIASGELREKEAELSKNSQS